MRAFMITLLECSAVMSALTLLYMLLNRLLAKRYAEKWRYYAWLIIVIGLIVPFRPTFGSAAIKIDAPERLAAPVIEAGGRTFADPYGPHLEFTPDPEIKFIEPPEPGSAQHETNYITPGAPAAPLTAENISVIAFNILSSISWWDVAVIVWLLGMTAFIAYHAAKHLRFTKMTNRWRDEVEDAQTIELFQDLKTEMKITKHIDLHLCPFAASPMLVGIVKPRILLPETHFAQDELRLIIKHELVHYKRKDVFYRFLLLLANAIHWFNPIVHLLARAVDMGCELSCDDEVVKGADIETRRYYSTTILGVVKYQTKLKTLLSTHLNGGKKAMKKRLSAIMDIGRKRGGVIIACFAVVAVLATGLILAVNTNKPFEDTPRQATETHTDAEGNVTKLNYLEALPETDKLVLWRDTRTDGMIIPAIKIFKRMYPGVEVELREFDDWDEYWSMLRVEIPAGKGPDMFLTNSWEFPDMYKVMDTGVFCDLNDFIDNDPDFSLDGYIKPVMDAGVYKGKRYIAPLHYYPNLMITTEETLERAGIGIESLQSFDRLTGEIKNYIENHDSPNFVYNFQKVGLNIYFPYSGIEIIDYENKTVNVDNDDFRKLMEAQKDIYNQDETIRHTSGVGTNYDGIYSIRDGNLFTMLRHNTSYFSEYYGVLATNWTPVYFVFPSVNGKKNAYVATQLGTILSSSANKLNAYRFLKILLSEQIQGADPWDVFYTGAPVLKNAVATRFGYPHRRCNEKIFDGTLENMKSGRINTPEEVFQDFVDIITDIDYCGIYVQTSLEGFYIYPYMEPYFKGEDTYENCLNKLRNYLELYVSE